MTQPPLRKFSTAGPEGDGRQAYVNDTGAYLGRGVALLERDAEGRWKPRDAAVLAPLLAKGYGVPVELGWRERRLRYIAEALNKGDLFLASLSLVYLELPPLPSDDHACAMAKADGLLVKFNPNWDRQRRDPRGEPTGGRWSGGGVSEAGASNPATSVAPKTQPNVGVEQVALQEDPTHAKKRLFVEAHLADAQKAANALQVPVENIIGISALESEWGKSNFAINANNYFGIHYPSPRAKGFMLSKDPPHAKVATFASYGEGAEDFADRFRHIVGGVSDPEQFARILQDKAKFGINSDGTKVRYYAGQVAATIIGLRSFIHQYKI